VSAIQSDQDLIRSLVRKDRVSLRELFGRLAPMMLAVASRILRRREDAEDVVNEVFLELFNRPEAYSADRGSVQTYLLLVTRSRAIDRLRRRIARDARESGGPTPIEEVASKSLAPGEDLERDEIRTRVASVVRDLPSDERDALEQAFYNGLSHAEIAKQSNVPLGTVKGRVRRALVRLRDRLLAVEGGVRR
jgi:RNA polymerase sigma-70 factor (ECF subfamily)